MSAIDGLVGVTKMRPEKKVNLVHIEDYKKRKKYARMINAITAGERIDFEPRVKKRGIWYCYIGGTATLPNETIELTNEEFFYFYERYKEG